MKFDPGKFRAHLESRARKVKVTLDDVLDAADVESAAAARSCMCLCSRDLLESQNIGTERRKHIAKCDFCQVFIRLWYVRYVEGEDFMSLLASVGGKLGQHPFALYKEYKAAQASNGFGDCYVIAEIVIFDTLSDERKDHETRCGECHMTVKFVHAMDTPELF